jgi:hypothetical protein
MVPSRHGRKSRQRGRCAQGGNVSWRQYPTAVCWYDLDHRASARWRGGQAAAHLAPPLTNGCTAVVDGRNEAPKKCRAPSTDGLSAAAESCKRLLAPPSISGCTAVVDGRNEARRKCRASYHGVHQREAREVRTTVNKPIDGGGRKWKGAGPDGQGAPSTNGLSACSAASRAVRMSAR